MRRRWLCVLAMCAACDGIAIGDSGKSADAVPTCTRRTEEPVSDPAKVPQGFSQSPNELFAPLTGTWRGTLTLTQGEAVPLTVEITVDESSIASGYVDDSDGTCEPWLTAKVTLVIDAGPTLRGTAEGELTTRDDAQIRADWIDFANFESTLEVPAFGAEIVSGPALVLDFLFGSDGQWHAEWQFAAQVKTEPCGPKTVMCTGTPAGFTPAYQSLGNVVLPRREAP